MHTLNKKRTILRTQSTRRVFYYILKVYVGVCSTSRNEVESRHSIESNAIPVHSGWLVKKRNTLSEITTRLVCFVSAGMRIKKEVITQMYVTKRRNEKVLPNQRKCILLARHSNQTQNPIIINTIITQTLKPFQWQ